MLINAFLNPLRRALVRQPPPWLRYGVAASATAATLWLASLLAPATHGHYLPLTMAVIVLSGLFGGLGPGLLAVVIAVLVTVVAFYPPYGELALVEPAHLYRILLFQVVAAFLALFGAALRRTILQIEQAAQDAAAQRRADQRRAAQQAVAAELGLLALGTQEPAQIMESVAAAAGRALGAPLSLVARLDRDGHTLHSAASSGWREGQPPECSWPLDPSTPIGYAASSHLPVVIEDLERESRFQLPRPVLAAGVQSLVAVAIYAPVSGGRAYGSLAVYDRVPRHYSRSEVQFLQLLANIIAVSLERDLDRQILRLKEDELRLAHQHTVQSLARWEAVIEHIGDGLIVLNGDGGLEAVNPAAEQMHGVAVEQVRHRPLEELTDMFEVYDRSGGQLPQEQWPLARLLRGQSFADQELLVRRRDSGLSHVLSYSGSIVDGGARPSFYVLTCRDVTAARRQEEDQRFLASASTTLSESLDHDEIFERLVHLAVPWLADWCAIDVPGADGTLELLAVAHADPDKVELARELREHYPPRLDSPRGGGRVVRTGEPEFVPEIPDQLLESLAQDARHLTLLRGLGLRSGMVVPLIARGRTLGTMTLIHSESGRRYSEGDLATAQDLASRAALAVDNARLYREAQDASRLRDHLMAVVSHDLRNALGVVRINAGLLLRGGKAPPQQQRPLQAMERATQRMDRLINDLLDVTSIQGGGLRIEAGAFPAVELLREAAEQQEELAAEQGIRLRLEESVADLVHCDVHRVSQVLGNLIGNAIKFCGQDDHIRLSARRSGASVRFTVADSGPGISSEDQQRIFAPYWSGEGGRSRGTGLGLFISRGIIEAHGGRLWVESAPEAGSRFHFTLPLAEADRSSAPAAVASS